MHRASCCTSKTCSTCQKYKNMDSKQKILKAIETEVKENKKILTSIKDMNFRNSLACIIQGEIKILKIVKSIK